MPSTLDPALLAQLMRLPEDQRSELAGRLIDSLDAAEVAASPSEIKATWIAELNRRSLEADGGSVAGVPYEQAWRQIVGTDE